MSAIIFSESSMDVLDSAVRVSGLHDSDGIAASGGKPTRKRQKLDHLTTEEKLLRRKMKNRAAAQNARDRKKAHMDELEIQVTELVRSSKQLAAENERLRKTNADQQRQIEELQARLAAADEQKTNVTAEGSLRHAEGSGSIGGDVSSPVRSPAADVKCKMLDDHDDSGNDDNNHFDEEEEQHLSLFDDTDLVDLLLEQSATCPTAAEAPTILVEPAPIENLDHVYHKQEPCVPTAVTGQLLMPVEDLHRTSAPHSPLSSSFSSSSSSSSGYDSDRSSEPMPWEESFSDLFPDLV